MMMTNETKYPTASHLDRSSISDGLITRDHTGSKTSAYQAKNHIYLFAEAAVRDGS